MYRILGVDPTAVPRLNAISVYTLLAEAGRDVSRFANPAAFVSWLGLYPQTDKSGGRVLSARTRRTTNRLNRALRLAAQALHRSQSYLGNYYRRMRSRLGASKAITATAHKLARIVFHLLRTGEAYNESISPSQSSAAGCARRIASAARPDNWDTTWFPLLPRTERVTVH